MCECKARCVFKFDVQICGVALNLSLKCQTELQLFDVGEWGCAGDQVRRTESDDMAGCGAGLDYEAKNRIE